jgi:cell division protein FtsQ
MFKKILKILGWVFLAAFIGVTVAFTSMESKVLRCSEIEIVYDGQSNISIGDETIRNIVRSADKRVETGNFYDINSEYIENALRQNKTIEKAEVYKSVVATQNKYKGIMTVVVKHRSPVVRVMADSADFYLDRAKIDIPVSTKYPVDLVVITGHITPELITGNLVEFAEYINNDKFLKAQIEQVDIQPNGEAVLIPLVGNQHILFGTLDDYEEKFANLKVFYEKVMEKNNWGTYKNIVLKYKNQVIGTKS